MQKSKHLVLIVVSRTVQDQVHPLPQPHTVVAVKGRPKAPSAPPPLTCDGGCRADGACAVSAARALSPVVWLRLSRACSFSLMSLPREAQSVA
jgi:hypothetical protein